MPVFGSVIAIAAFAAWISCAEASAFPVLGAFAPAFPAPAISVSVGNALKHAGGKKVAIFVSEKDGLYIIKFTNDGRAPIGPVVEKGGLANLRREVESVGGTMEVTHQPEFLMTITLPKPGV